MRRAACAFPVEFLDVPHTLSFFSQGYALHSFRLRYSVSRPLVIVVFFSERGDSPGRRPFCYFFSRRLRIFLPELSR